MLKEHSGTVTAIDWNAKSNLIVTSGQDRNAYVWKWDGETKEWKPTLVILRINRAATSVKWSPEGTKFAVTSGAKCVPICHFEESNNWWISKMIKKHKSTVTSIDWSPNSKFVITGATDFKARIFSGFIEGIDDPKDDGFGEIWPKQNEFGEQLAEFDVGSGWVNAVAWSPSGSYVAFASHGSAITVVKLAGSSPTITNVYLKTLPALVLHFFGDDLLVSAGFDLNPRVLVRHGEAWSVDRALDPETDTEGPKVEKKQGPAGLQAFKKTETDGKQTFHKNTILDLKVQGGTKFTTCGVDGRILFWDAK